MTRGDPKKLKLRQIKKLKTIALDGRRRLIDRRWAATQLSNHGIEVGANIPGYATPGEGRRWLLETEGGCVTIAEASKRYRRPKLTAQIKRGEVLAFRGGDGRIHVPVWQFKPDGGVLDGLLAAFKLCGEAAKMGPIGFLCFLHQPVPMLELRTPLEALRSGEAEQVLAAVAEYSRGP